jgi:S1-C subfamily serine protease
MKNAYYRTYLIVVSLFLIPITSISLTTIAASETAIIAQDIFPGLDDYVKSTTVKINSNVYGGLGVIIGKKNNTYLVLTKSNISQFGNTFEIQTSDGKTYKAKLLSNPTKLNSNVALLEFNSKDDHNVAELNPSAIPAVGQETITIDYDYPTGTLIYTEGIISEVFDDYFNQNNSTTPILNSEKKIEERAVLNTNGELLGFTSPDIRSVTFIYNYLQQLNSEILTKYQLPQSSETLEIPTPLLTGKLKEIETKTQKITVRIDRIIEDDSEDTNSTRGKGSGVIIARKGDTYTVLTARHVLCELENNIDDCKRYNHSIITSDDISHEVDKSTIAPAKAKDLAT